MDSARPKVLVAPLDWGLGHATRCISIIHELKQQACEVVIASSGAQKKLLSLEFPELRIIDLPSYGLEYGKSGWATRLHLVLQTPKILRRIRSEGAWLRQILASESFDLLISDNRYGFFSPGLVTVFISHQLNLRSGFGKFFDTRIAHKLFNYIEHFSYCWIPDHQFPPFLAGSMSHPETFPATDCRYIGPLSRFRKLDLPVSKDSLLILLSGPEPQRSILERKIIRELHQCPCHCTLVRGLPESEQVLPKVPDLISYNHLPSDQLNRLICESEFIICRSGYTSVMELLTLGKKTIMVPTPGQAEQEYLATHLHQENRILKADQSTFNLNSLLDEAKGFPYHLPHLRLEGGLEQAVSEVLDRVEEFRRKKLDIVSKP